MRLQVVGRMLGDHRRMVMWWVLGLVAFSAMTVAPYPSLRDQPDFDELIEGMPDALLALFGIEKELSLVSPEGYLVSQLFGFMVPMLFVVLAVSVGSRAIASEEERGTLDLLLAQPISRRRVALEKFGGLVAITFAVGFALWVMLAVGGPMFDLDVGPGDLAVATLASVLFGLQVGALALAIGAAVGRRATAIGVASAVAVLGFAMESLAEISSAFESVGWLSPFHFANGNTPLVNGLRALDVAVLLGLILGAVAVGVAVFERRDLAT